MISTDSCVTLILNNTHHSLLPDSFFDTVCNPNELMLIKKETFLNTGISDKLFGWMKKVLIKHGVDSAVILAAEIFMTDYIDKKGITSYDMHTLLGGSVLLSHKWLIDDGENLSTFDLLPHLKNTSYWLIVQMQIEILQIYEWNLCQVNPRIEKITGTAMFTDEIDLTS